MLDFPLMLRVKLPVVDGIQPQSKFATGDSKRNDSPAWCRQGGLKASKLDSESGRLGLSPGQGHCIVFLGNTLAQVPGYCLSPTRCILV